MKLYASATSPYARKVRVVIDDKQLPVEFVALETAGDARVPVLNPLGKIPVLERDDGSVLFDSSVIVEYLDALNAPALIPVAGEARWQTLRLAALGDGIMDAVVARLLEMRRPEPQRSCEAIAYQEGKIARAIGFAERQLGDKPWLVEGRFTLADVALVTALEYVDFRYPHPWKLNHPRLTQWLANAGTRPSFVATQPPK